MKFMHFRIKQFGKLSATGGITVAAEHLGEGRVQVGIARCSMKDNYNKHIGRQLAKARLATHGVNLPERHLEEELQDILIATWNRVANRRGEGPYANDLHLTKRNRKPATPKSTPKVAVQGEYVTVPSSLIQKLLERQYLNDEEMEIVRDINGHPAVEAHACCGKCGGEE